MAIGIANLGFPLLTSLLPSSPSSRNPLIYSKSPGRRPALHPIFSSPAEEVHRVSFTDPEIDLIDALIGIQGRGRSAPDQQLKDVGIAVEALENLKGIADPTNSDLIEGCWQLVFTTRPGTASPIQRTFVGVDIFKIFQEVYLRTKDPRVINTVQFSNQIGELKVEAAATVENGKRILFQFDRAAFSFKFLPFKVPYPVPFRLLGDEAKGWLDTTYLSTSGSIRISRGNKGTTFVLQKEVDLRQKLLLAVFSGAGVADVIDVLLSKRSKVRADFDALEGEWQLLWSSQASVDNWKVAATTNSLKGLQIVKKNGNLENHNTLFPGFRLCTSGSIIKSGANRFEATVDAGAYFLGPVRFPAEIKSNYSMEVLYIDDKIRITRQNEAIMMIHLHVGNSEGNQI